MRRETIAIVLAATFLLIARPWPGHAQAGALRQAFQNRFVGKSAPPLTLEDTKGRTVRLADLKGKVVLLNFWHSACLPCRKETPDLADLYRRYKDRGLVVLGINLDAIFIPQAQGKELEGFLRSVEVPYPVLRADRAAFEAYGSAPVQPVSFLVDREGLVARVFWGAFPGAVFEKAIHPYVAARIDLGR